MEYKLLESNGVEHSFIDGAAFNNIAVGACNGVLKGVLNECQVYQPSSNIIEISTGELIIQGFRVKLLSPYSAALTAEIPSRKYHIVARISVTSDKTSSFQIVCRDLTALLQESIHKTEQGIYEIELAQFVNTADGIQQVKRTVTTIGNDYKKDIQDVLNASYQALEASKSAHSISTINSKRLDNVESVLSKDRFIIDSATTYRKSIPVGVAPYATINKIGGMTYKDGNALKHTKVKALKSKSKNLLNLLGWSATADKKVLNNSFGTTVSSLEGNHITVSQSNYPNASNLASYENGFFMFFPDKHLVSGKDYKVSFDLRIINNPLDASFVHIVANDYWNGKTQVDISKTNSVQRCSGLFTYNINSAFPNNCYLECRNCGISFEIGNVMITEADVEDIEYSPYGTIDTFTIPEAVQNREGYGLGIEGYPNIVEYANGRVKFDKRVKMGVVSKIAHVSWADYSHIKYYAFNMPSDYIGYKTDAFMLEGFDKKPPHSNWDSTEFIGVATGLATEYEVWVGFPKSTTQTEAEAALLGKSFVYALATPEVTDITDLMPTDNYIKVEGGGTIIADNEYEYDVPTTITYQKRG